MVRPIAGLRRSLRRLAKLVRTRRAGPDEAARHPIAGWGGVLGRPQDVEAELAPLRDQISRRVPHERDFEFFAAMEGIDGLFVDAGANAGQSAASLRSVNQTLRILSFEPNPMLEPILRRIRDGLLPHFDYRMTGLSDRREWRVLYVPVVDGLLVTPLATLDPSVFTRRHYHEQLEGLSLAGAYEIEEVVVQLEPLDELELDPAVIKIDTEEHEVACLNGMTATIARARPIFMVERNPQEEEIDALLAGHGYRRFSYDADAARLVPFDASSPAVNMFFVPAEHDRRR